MGEEANIHGRGDLAPTSGWVGWPQTLIPPLASVYGRWLGGLAINSSTPLEGKGLLKR
jgi:hypothetical protein